MTRPLWPWRLGYVVVEVPDVVATGNLLAKYLQLHEDRTGGEHRVFRGGLDHHWVILEPGSQMRLKRMAFEVRSRSDLEALGKRLADAGVATETGADRAAGIGDYVRFADPDGNPIELFTSMVQMPVPTPPRMINTVTLLHAVLLVPDVPKRYSFYSDLLGMRASDWVEDSAVFLHAGIGYHHSLALIKAGDRTGLDHICFLMSSLDDVMRIRARTMVDGIAARTDIKRHAPSGSISYYIEDTTSGLVFEVTWDHLRIPDSNAHQVRVLPKRPETANLWLASDDGGAVVSKVDGPLGNNP